jgi:hypothetical protein
MIRLPTDECPNEKGAEAYERKELKEVAEVGVLG